jgi:hypothetical protein
MDLTIGEMMEMLERIWPIDANTYRRLNEISAASRTDFLRDHQLKHLVEVVGELAARCEKRDHRPLISHGLTPHVATIVTKLIMNALQLARIEGMSTDEVVLALRIRFKFDELNR